MNDESYIVNIGILARNERHYYDLKEQNTTHILFNDYIKCQRYLFRIIDHYNEFDEKYRKRIIIWLDIHKCCENDDIFERSYSDTYFYYYKGEIEKNSIFSLSPIRDEEFIESIRHYIPEGCADDYRQAVMEYKLLNK